MNKLLKKNVSIILIAMILISIFSVAVPTHVTAENDLQNIYLRTPENVLLQEHKLFNELKCKDYNNKDLYPYIVSFSGPIYDYMKDEIKEAGAEIVEYIPDFSFLVRMTAENAKKVQKLSCVKDIVVYDPLFKIDPNFMDNVGNIKDMGEIKVRISTFDDDFVNNEINLFDIEQLNSGTNNIIVSINSKELMDLANLNSVKFIEFVPEFQLFNDVAKGYMDADDIWNLGYKGSDQVVGIADTGLDTGKNDSSMHKDFQGRIDKIIPLGRDTADDPHGHGTHVAGSVLGSGERSEGKYKGIAPEAHLVFQSVLDGNNGLGGLPYDLKDLFEQSRKAGARIHTNSWGSASKGEYNKNSKNVDEYVWNNNDMIILFAAGNEGYDNGRTVYNSIGSPGTAKNCITVGASENYRSDKGKMADNPNEIALFSSRGNCKDGRIKPDIVAPGTWILSTKSSKAPEENFWEKYNDYYAYMGGTSMATPLTAGAVAVAREYMEKEWNHTPSAAMMKAAIINGGTDLGYGYPSRDQGWGRISLVDSLDSKEYEFEDQKDSLSTDETKNFTYFVESSNTPLRISLVWTDYPGSIIASKALVNDLDVKVTSPSGIIYYGNDFSEPYDSKYDRINNVENVWIDTPETGNYTVEVIAYNVPNGPQSFALFSSGDFGTAEEDEIAPTCSITAPSNGDTVKDSITISAEAEDNVAVKVVEFYVDGSKVGEDRESPYNVEWDTTEVENGDYTLQVKAIDTSNNTGDSDTIKINVENDGGSGDDDYKTETFTGKASYFEGEEFKIDVTAKGKIELRLIADSSFDVYLYSPSGTMVQDGNTYVEYDAVETGEYTILVYASSFGMEEFALEATYPVRDSGGPEEDEIAPTCSITAPSNGDTVKDSITISAEAEDNVAVKVVEFYVDGSKVGEDRESPYNVEWDTTEVENGDYTLQVKAIDTSNNTGDSDTIKINVENDGGSGDDDYKTETFTGKASFFEGEEFKIDVTAKGKIELRLIADSSFDVYLYSPSGTMIQNENTYVEYDAVETGEYTILVYASSFEMEEFTLEATYPVGGSGTE